MFVPGHFWLEVVNTLGRALGPRASESLRLFID